MIFSSLVFLYVFLPLVLIIYYLIKEKYRNSFLFLSSVIFFAWGGVSYSALLLISIFFNYLFGLGIVYKPRFSKVWLALGVTVNLSFLGVFKYAGWLTESINSVLGWTGQTELPVPEILLPIGISFYTFQAISYLVDLQRKEAEVQRNIVNLGLYISLFPQLIAGPIVRYHDISTQIKSRKHNSEKFSEGVERFVLGLAKKVLIANNLAIVADQVFN